MGSGPAELSYTISPKSDDQPIGNSKLILSGDINPEQLDEIINNSSIEGIAIEGGDEERPGFKDMDALADILEALDEEY
jgi:phosphoribosylanthranilate isomerase